MSEQKSDTRPDQLQFDRAIESGAGAPDSAVAQVVCANCQTAIPSEYFAVGGSTICRQCRNTIGKEFERAAYRSRTLGATLRTFALGLAAAVLGAILYYAVIAITNFEIGIVAIVIGFMVGWAVRRGSSGLGGRRYQVMAVALTYFAVALAYTPLAVSAVRESAVAAADSAAVADSATAAAAAGAEVPSGAEDGLGADPSAQTPSFSEIGPVGATLALAAAMLGILALPLLVVFGSMPSGLISALIIGFGMHQAWRMTAGVALDISGPYKVGGEPGEHAPAA